MMVVVVMIIVIIQLELSITSTVEHMAIEATFICFMINLELPVTHDYNGITNTIEQKICEGHKK